MSHCLEKCIAEWQVQYAVNISICLWVKVSRTSDLPTIKRTQLTMSVKYALKQIKPNKQLVR